MLSEESIKEIVKVADRVGAWILSDEVYRGAELNGKETPTFWGKYEKVIVNGGLSKAYALPGLRIGWMVGPKKLIANSWANHDYSTIAPGVINDYLASLSLKSEMRQKILSRNRKILNKNLALVKEWLPNHADLFKLIPPCAGGIAFIHYNLDINST